MKEEGMTDDHGSVALVRELRAEGYKAIVQERSADFLPIVERYLRAGQRAQAEKDAAIAETNCRATKQHLCTTDEDCVPLIAAAIRAAAPKEGE